MRAINLIVIHCSAVRPDQTSSVAQIDTWHREDRHYKFGVGHHDLNPHKDCPCFDAAHEYKDLQP